MKFIKKLGARLNPTQKIIIAVSVPIVLFIIAIAFANNISYGYPFDMEDTWLMWVIFIVIIGYFEFDLFSEK